MTETVETVDDVALVQRTLTGDQQAFTQLVERYKDPVYNLAYRMLGNQTEAEDVAQEAFVKAYTQLHTYRDSHKFSTWLLSITSHLAIDLLRRRRFVAMPLEDSPVVEWMPDVGAGPEESALIEERHDEMQHLLRKLPEKYRSVVVLRYYQDMSYEEIAATLHLTPALVKARLHRARELLGRALKEEPGRGRLDALSTS